MNRSRLILAGISLLILVNTALIPVGWSYWRFVQHPVTGVREFTVEEGWHLQQVADALEKQGIIASATWFYWIWRVQEAGSVQAGDYRFEAGETPYGVMHRLKTGQVVQNRLVIPEGMTVKDVARLMRAAGWADAEKELINPSLVSRLGIPAPSLEGWLFPETYFFRRKDSLHAMLTRMVEQTRQVLADEWASRPAEHTLDTYQTLILASVVEKETGDKDERPLIARVFLNRLKKNMRLDSDPTVIYGIADFDGNITRKHLTTPTPFNTYTRLGLPPTPICNPGREAIHAVLHPVASEALFFVASGEGKHVFANSLAEHRKNVDKYQKKNGS